MSERARAVPAGAFAKALLEEAGVSADGRNAAVPGMGASPLLVHEPGGDLLRRLLHPNFKILERFYRVLPEEGWFGVTVAPNNPVQFDLGSYEVPGNYNLWLFEYRFATLIFSGIDPSDYFEAAAGRFSGVLGFDLTIRNRRKADLLYELDPVPVQFGRQQFEPPLVRDTRVRAAPAQFNRQAARSFAAVSSQGLALLPANNRMQGPANGPFTFVIDEGESVNLSCVIFRRVFNPLAAIQGEFSGYLLHEQLSKALINRLRPT